LFDDEKEVRMWNCIKRIALLRIRYKKFLIFIEIMLGLSVILGVFSRLSAEFSEFWASNVYPVFITTVGRFFGIFPFSVFEIFLIILALGVIPGVVIVIRKKVVVKAFLWTFCAACSLLTVYIANCGVMYNRCTFLHEFDVCFYRYEGDEEKVFRMILEEFNEKDLISQIHTDEDGVFMLSVSLAETAPAAMRSLARDFPRLDVYYPRPKPFTVIGSEFMTMGRFGGVFYPFTIEANYNNIMPDADKPTTALHELAHVAGFMREEEANFIAFLAGKDSGVPELEYAAYLDMFNRFSYYRFCFETGEDLFPEQVLRDLIARYEFWHLRVRDNPVVQVISDVVGDVSEVVNDVYLQSQGVEDGVLSYGRVIDLVMAWYLVS
jgi:hypothetical protein